MLVADVDIHMLPDAHALFGLELLVHPEVVQAIVGSAVGSAVGLGLTEATHRRSSSSRATSVAANCLAGSPQIR